MCSFAIGLQLFLDSPGISTPQQSENELTTLIFGRRRCGMRCELLIVREIVSNFEIHQFSALRVQGAWFILPLVPGGVNFKRNSFIQSS